MLISRFLSRIVLEKQTTYLWVDETLCEKDMGEKGKNVQEDGWSQWGVCEVTIWTGVLGTMMERKRQANSHFPGTITTVTNPGVLLCFNTENI